MGQKLIVGPINKGLRNDVEAFNIDNDSFPVLINAYQWRGRAKRKRGTSFLTRLRRYFDSTNASYNTGTTTFTLNGSGEGNLLVNASWTLQTNGNIEPGGVIITAPGPTVYTDPAMDGTLSPSGSINYATGAITIAAEVGNAVSVIFSYFPDLPVMGLREFFISTQAFPAFIDFDTTYSYNTINTTPFTTYDVSFYKNPATGDFPGYIEKTSVTPATWNAQDYQQFYTVNYQGAIWATNGINMPFSITNIGMHFRAIQNIAVTAAGPPSLVSFQVNGHGLVQGDFIYINEVVSDPSGPTGLFGINFQTGYVILVTGANTFNAEFPNATITGAYAGGGIAQYLTNRSDVTKDCLRWYDGDPTDGNLTTPTLNGHKGWVNFCPPLSQSNFIIADLPADQWYLVGARVIVPFKDRLLFFGPVVQTSSAGSQIYLPDTVIYSQNGTPYYTVSYTNDPNPAVDNPTSPQTIFTPILLPINQTGTPSSFFGDSTGFGGYIQAAIDQDMISVSTNEDALIVGFTSTQTRLVYSGNDIVPFNFFIINSEYGTGSTFSTINMDKGVLTTGSRGILTTSQTESRRIDLEIPDEIFQFRLTDNGLLRVTATRDYINEWIYFTYPYGQIDYRFPTQTLQFNYRDNSWAVFRETYTTYGQFNKQDGFTWQTVGNTFATWEEWDEPWNAGTSNLLQPLVTAGNQQGFVLIRDDGTGEGESLYIRAISGDTVTCPDHCLNTGDYILIKGCIGTNVGIINGHTFSIRVVDNDSFIIELGPIHSVTYLGRGLVERIYVPFIQSKQFPAAWADARKTRLGPQQYLLTATQNSQITLLIYLSQNASSPYNDGPIVPEANVENNALVYSTVLYTCPESTNLGLTPANINLNSVTAEQQKQIWHRINTSLLGDTVQVAFTLSAAQLEASPFDTPLEITGATQANPLVLTCANTLNAGQLIQISEVGGMTELNSTTLTPHIYQILSRTDTEITIEVDSSGFGTYTSGGLATPVNYKNATAEIELHAFILDVNPSQVLA